LTDNGKSGLATALEATGPGVPPAAAAEQLALLPEPALPDAPRTRAAPGGRPRGSRNRRTQEWVDYLLGKGRSPLEFLHALYQRPAAKLAEELGLYLYHEGKLVLDAAGAPVLAVGEAFRRQVEAAAGVAPYLHQKLPVAIDVKGKTAGLIVVGDMPAAGSDQAAVLNLFMAGEAEAEAEQNQALSGPAPAGSDEQKVG
jgi:hypothetical protein